MDLHLIDAPPTDEERAAVDGVLGVPDTGWAGGVRSPLDGHVAYGGVAEAASRRHLLLPALHALQDSAGHISRGGLGYVCRRLSVPPAEAYGVAGFYAMLATEDQPRRVAHVCDDVPCRLRGADALAGDLEAGLGPEGTDVAGSMWLSSPCLGRCDQPGAAFLQLAGEPRRVETNATAPQLIEALSGDHRNARRAPPTTAVAQPALENPLIRTTDGSLRDLDAYIAAGGYRALHRAIEQGPVAVLDEIEASGLRGRGGAAFPAAVKWRAVAASDVAPRYVVCNADESEPGTFKDRLLLESDPFATIEAMTIAGLTVGAERGYLYVRGEYPDAEDILLDAIHSAESAGLLGADVANSDARFDIEVRRGGGAYICGEETALFNSIEGYRGEPRQKPPFPTEAGLFGKPTLVNNVETLANIPRIVRDGGAAFSAVGTAESTGTRLFCVSGHVAAPGVYEVALGTTLGELLALAGGVDGTLRAVLVGGAAGTFVGPDRLDLPLAFETARIEGISLGSGAVIVMNDTTDFKAVVRRISAFFRDESCGQCVPCRVGTVRQEEAVVRITTAGFAQPAADRLLLAEIDRAMRDASICGLGHTAGSAVRSALELGLIGGEAPS